MAVSSMAIPYDFQNRMLFLPDSIIYKNRLAQIKNGSSLVRTKRI